MPLTHRPLSALLTLAAQARLMGLGLMAELAAWLGAGAFAAGLRRRISRDVAQLERFATGIVVLMALKRLPVMPEPGRAGRRPANAPGGFRCVAAGDDGMRAMRRRLFPGRFARMRNLNARLARLDAVLDRALAAAARLARFIAKTPPAFRLVATAPPAVALATWATACPDASDTS